MLKHCLTSTCRRAALQAAHSQPQLCHLISLQRQAASPFSTINYSPAHDRLLVIGSGVAGSAAALIAAETHKVPVTMIFAGQAMTDCNSNWAQGGIIYRNYARDEETGEPLDSADSLAFDIHRAGAGLCDDDAVRKVSEEGPDRVRQLLLASEGNSAFAQVPFDRCTKNPSELSLCLEASHSAPRILHYADKTGAIITQHITHAAARHPLITMQGHTIVTDLIVTDGYDSESKVCVGVEILDRSTGQRRMEYATRGVLLASGGLAGIYQHSTNPAGFNALGSSVALAQRAGAACRDLEFVQFHPTALCIPNAPRFLLSEAIRGEGAILRDASGRAFAKEYHPHGELAPRDVVARAVFSESQKVSDEQQEHNVFLDITHRDRDWLHQRFPSIQAHIAQFNLDMGRDQIPIIPAAHYTCGGVTTDLNGCTNIHGLFAAGEAARTGLHGGNRLASTSLLEGLVFGASVADFVGGQTSNSSISSASGSQGGTFLQERIQNAIGETTYQIANKNNSASPNNQETVGQEALQLLVELKRTMWDHVGVVRTPKGLQTAEDELDDILEQADYLHETMGPTLETAAVRDAAYAGLAVTQSALRNRTSAGAHFIILDSEEESKGEDSGKDSDSDEEEMAAAAQS